MKNSINNSNKVGLGVHPQTLLYVVVVHILIYDKRMSYINEHSYDLCAMTIM